MEDSSISVLYDLISYMERERKRLRLATIIVLLLVPIGLTWNAISLFSILTEDQLIMKYAVDLTTTLGIGRHSIFLIILISNIATSIGLVYLGARNLSFLNSWGKKLDKIEGIEKKIYDEVIKDEKISGEE
ncbi:MAG: hypothetical protein HPY60_00185 [Candidatus Methanofastidiosum sp.]|nr:hypothetical protein [Methanofastidiosum sp.]NYT03713.1 hypothetical protein [Candidatus Methanofastidiosa archaeon]